MNLVSFTNLIVQTRADARFYEQEPQPDRWFRYEDRAGNLGTAEIWLMQYRIIRETPKGVWLDDFTKERFVLHDARKRWAYPTTELARQSFLIRKRKQLAHLASWHDRIRATIVAVEKE